MLHMPRRHSCLAVVAAPSREARAVREARVAAPEGLPSTQWPLGIVTNLQPAAPPLAAEVQL